MTTQQHPKGHPEQEILERTWQRVEPFLRQNWLHIILGVALLIAAGAGWRAYRYRREAQSYEAWTTLGTVTPGLLLQLGVDSAEAEELRQEAILQLQRLIDSGPDSSAEPWAMVELGGLYAAGREWGQAAATYAQLVRRYPDSMAAQVAAPNWAAALEGLGEYAEAAKKYDQLARQESPLYWLHAARCLELAGEAQEARRRYELFLDEGPDEPQVVQLAKARLADVEQGRLLPAPPEPAPPSKEQQGVPALPGVTPLHSDHLGAPASQSP